MTYSGHGRRSGAPTSDCSRKILSVADFMKNLRYATGQFGKNHLGDLNKFPPTVHGFARVLWQPVSPERRGRTREPDYPEGTLRVQEEIWSKCGVMHRWATDTDDATVDPVFWQKSASRRSRTPSALTVKRMETIDDEFTDAATAWMEKQTKRGQAFLLLTTTRRGRGIVLTHLKKRVAGCKTGLGLYPDGIVEHDAHVGQILKKLDDLGICGKTPSSLHHRQRGRRSRPQPDGGATPFRGGGG